MGFIFLELCRLSKFLTSSRHLNVSKRFWDPKLHYILSFWTIRFFHVLKCFLSVILKLLIVSWPQSKPRLSFHDASVQDHPSVRPQYLALANSWLFYFYKQFAVRVFSSLAFLEDKDLEERANEVSLYWGRLCEPAVLTLAWAKGFAAAQLLWKMEGRQSVPELAIIFYFLQPQLEYIYLTLWEVDLCTTLLLKVNKTIFRIKFSFDPSFSKWFAEYIQLNKIPALLVCVAIKFR